VTPIGRGLVGILTTILFLVIGVSILEDAPPWGWLVILLGVLRGGYAIMQIRAGVQSPLGLTDDDGDDESA